MGPGYWLRSYELRLGRLCVTWWDLWARRPCFEVVWLEPPDDFTGGSRSFPAPSASPRAVGLSPRVAHRVRATLPAPRGGPS